MRSLLLACLLGAVASVSAKYCNKGNYACVGEREFCLGNLVFECAEGTVCTGSTGGHSPCTWPESKQPCPGDFDDYACCSSKHYCLKGFQVACKAGTKCRGDGGSGGHPCRATKKRVVKKDPKNPKHHKWEPAEPEACANGDNMCTSNTTYCDGGCEIKCPKGTVCKGEGPCVHETKCKDPGGVVPECTVGNWTCLNDNEYCQDKTAWRCPDGTKCSGSVNGKSPCTVEVAGYCPGAYDDFQCIDKNSYCLGGSVLKCAANTYCNPATDSGDGNPCQPTQPVQPACTQSPYSCVNLDSYCAFGVGFDCPGVSICRGSAPCTTQPDEQCKASDNECLEDSDRDFCFQGETLRCPDGFKCVGSPDGVSNPCKEDLPPAQCPGPFDDDVCFDIGHYCLGGMSMECPANTFCVGRIEEDEEPCLPDKPTNLTCTLPEMTCLTNTTYCSGGVHYLCPNTTLCTGLAPFPCVENAWCPATHDNGKDEHKPEPQHPDKPEDKHEPQCSEEDWKCRDKHEYCYKGEILRCPHRTTCKGSRRGRHCCEVEEPRQRCAGSWADFQCCDITHFCHGGFKTRCPAGTICLGSVKGESPCKEPRDVVQPKCPAGEYRCATDRSFCSGGKEFFCPGGTVCKGWAPCVYETGDVPTPGAY